MKDRKDLHHLHFTDGKTEAQRVRKCLLLSTSEVPDITQGAFSGDHISFKGRKNIWLVQGHLAAKCLIKTHSGLLCFPCKRLQSFPPILYGAFYKSRVWTVLYVLIHFILQMTLYRGRYYPSHIRDVEMEAQRWSHLAELTQPMRPKAKMQIQAVCLQSPKSEPVHSMVTSNALPLLKLLLGLQGLWSLDHCSLREHKIKSIRRCQVQASHAFKLIARRLQMVLQEFLLPPRGHWLWLHGCH